jgi:hypothetical protein
LVVRNPNTGPALACANEIRERFGAICDVRRD